MMKNNFNSMIHYYGDRVRTLFIIGALVMVAGLPFVAEDISLPLIVSITGILVVSVAAGITSPQFVWSSILNIFISLYAVVEFEWYAVHWYNNHSGVDFFFVINQVLAMIFLIALYFSVKTFRGVRSQVLDEETSKETTVAQGGR